MRTKSNKKLWLFVLSFLMVTLFSLGLVGVQTTNKSLATEGQVTNSFYMDDGASIRLTEGSTGIRFTGYLSTDLYNSNNEYGVIITPASYLTKHSISDDFINKLDTAYGTDQNGSPNGYLKMTSVPNLENGLYVIRGSIAKMRYENMNRKFVGIAYSFDGTNYVYADINGDISRSVAEVAADVYTEYQYKGNPNEYDTDDINIVKDFLNKAKNQATGNAENAMEDIPTTLALSSSTLNLKLLEEQTITATSNIDLKSIIWESSDNEIATVENGVVKAVGLGTATITAYLADATPATCEVTTAFDASGLTGNYVADFDSESYVNLLGKTSDAGLYPESLTTEIVSNVEDDYGSTAESAVKITVKPGSSGSCQFRLTLPKSLTTTTATYRIMIDSESTGLKSILRPGLFAFISIDNGGNITSEVGVTEMDRWYNAIYTLPGGYGIDVYGDYIDFNVNCNGNLDDTIVFYLDCIMDGDCRAELEEEIMKTLVEGLTGNYVANFNSKLYASLFSVPNSTLAPESLTTEIVSNVEDDYGSTAESAVKITVKPGSSGSCQFRLTLPKQLKGGAVTFRIMIKSESTNLSIVRPGMYEFIGINGTNVSSEVGMTEMNKWCDASHGYTDGTDAQKSYIEFNIARKDSNAAQEDNAVEIYLAWIRDDTVA